jgi:hypothetical protein
MAAIEIPPLATAVSIISMSVFQGFALVLNWNKWKFFDMILSSLENFVSE